MPSGGKKTPVRQFWNAFFWFALEWPNASFNVVKQWHKGRSTKIFFSIGFFDAKNCFQYGSHKEKLASLCSIFDKWP